MSRQNSALTSRPRSRDAGARIDVVTCQDAPHDFHDPSERRQSVATNHEALTDALQRALAAAEAARD
jgi:hypothetical protein